MAELFTLERCGSDRKLRNLPHGRYVIEYNDGTHLKSDQWVTLSAVEVQPGSIPLGEDDTEQFFTIQKLVGALPAEGQGNQDALEAGRRIRVVEDTLALALGRAGLLAPSITDELFEEIVKLNAEEGVVIVPDTNALHNGAVHWLLDVLRRPSVWLLPLAASLTTVQTRDATVKSLLGKPKPGNVKQALRSRGLVNGALGLLRRNRGRSQVVEIDHSLLRYQKTASNGGTDPDQGDVLEDRLIIEAIHSVLRSMRSRTARRVVTSDVNIARVLEAEGIDTLFVPTISLGDEPIDCLRYDALARSFVGAPLRSVVWELAHAFGSVRLVGEAGEIARLDCYWPNKTPRQWETETLSCAFVELQSPAPIRAGDALAEGDKSLSVSEQPTAERASDPVEMPERINSSTETLRLVAAPVTKTTPLKPAKKTHKKPARSSTPREKATMLPRATLPTSLKLLGLVRREGPSTAEQLAAMLGDRTTADTVKRGLELMRRVELVSMHGNKFEAAPDANLIDSLLQSKDLDGASAVFSRFEPYSVFLRLLEEREAIEKEVVVSLISEVLGQVGTYEAERLPRYHILLGQAWSDGDLFRIGSRRPTDRDATEIFQQAFRESSRDGLAKVVDLLPRMCRLAGMSPWAAKKQIERFVADRLLPDYNFEPSAGGKPVTRDEVLVGGIENISTEPVVIDRLHLGERPVFTIGGPEA